MNRVYFSKMNTLITRLLIIFLVIFSNNVSAQLVVENTMTPQQLVQQILIGSGVTATNVTFTGAQDSAIGNFYNGETTNLGIDEGIILSSGMVLEVPNIASFHASTNNGEPGDIDLDNLPGVLGTNDAAVLEFDFIPQSDTLLFNYVFGSEEYPEYVNQFNDVFAFFITGPNPAGPPHYNKENIALVPGTNLPVSINNVNNGPKNLGPCVNCEYYVNNTGGLTIVYDGFTTVLTAFVVVVPCETYHMKLAIADDLDHIFDSGVFLEANSFSATGLVITQNFSQSSNNFGATIEGCNDATIIFELYEPLPDDYVIGLTYSGTAINGIDYPLLPDSIVIPAGALSDSIIIQPYQDYQIEPTETVVIIMEYESACATETDTLETEILDNSIDFGGLDTVYCSNAQADTLWGYPESGVYSGPGMTDSIFYPSLANPGLNQIFFTNYFIDYSGPSPDTVCSNQLMLETIITTAPQAYAGSDDTICQGDPFDFSTLAILPDTSNCDSIKWIGGQGYFSDSIVLYPIYYSSINESGPVILSLIGYTQFPCNNDTSFMTLQVDSVPDGNFTSIPVDTCCVNELVYFYGTSTCYIISWQWDFGDGNTGSGQNVSHTYTSGGTFNVSLTIENAYGCDSTITYQRHVDSVDVDFNLVPSPACIGDTVYFNGTGDTITFTDWLWDFGDGGTAIGRNVNHVYSTYDTFNVTLIVCSDTNMHDIIIHQPASADAGSDEHLCESFPFDFTTSAILPTANVYDSIRWIGGIGSFNDSTLLTPIYTPGVGEVGPVMLSLIAYSKLPCSNDTSFMILTLDTLPDPDFLFIPNDSICVDELISFNGSNTLDTAFFM